VRQRATKPPPDFAIADAHEFRITGLLTFAGNFGTESQTIRSTDFQCLADRGAGEHREFRITRLLTFAGNFGTKPQTIRFAHFQRLADLCPPEQGDPRPAESLLE
jgi:hypothetical protein